MPTSKRFAILQDRPSQQDAFVLPWLEVGLIVSDSPADPKPSLALREGRVEEMDGVPREEMDLLDRFIADHALDLRVAAEAMSTPAETIARLLVDINAPRERVARLAAGCTAAKLVEVVRQLNVLEMMMALRPYRLRYEGLLALAAELERDYGAAENARLIREAAEAYKARGLE